MDLIVRLNNQTAGRDKIIRYIITQLTCFAPSKIVRCNFEVNYPNFQLNQILLREANNLNSIPLRYSFLDYYSTALVPAGIIPGAVRHPPRPMCSKVWNTLSVHLENVISQ